MTSVIRFFFVVVLGAVIGVHSALFDPFPTDNILPFHYELPDNTYHQYCKNIYPQNGEDGILQQLLAELHITRGTFCEFGAHNGIYSSNTYNLIKNYGFTGIAIELDASKAQECAINYRDFPNVRVFQGAVDYKDAKNDLNAWLKRGQLPYDLDILSIDIDCDDYYVWEKLTEFSPKIVIIETNPYRDPIIEELPSAPQKEYRIDPLREWFPGKVGAGSSFISTVRLGLTKGYIPVSYTGNLTFVRQDLVHNLKEFPYKISQDPYDYLTLYTHLALWDNQWYTNTALILNVAIRDHYLQFKEKQFDFDWVNARMNEILRNENVVY